MPAQHWSGLVRGGGEEWTGLRLTVEWDNERLFGHVVLTQVSGSSRRLPQEPVGVAPDPPMVKRSPPMTASLDGNFQEMGKKR